MGEKFYVEKTVKCVECEKEFKIVALEDSDDSDFICQRCSFGEIDDDIEN